MKLNVDEKKIFIPASFGNKTEKKPVKVRVRFPNTVELLEINRYDDMNKKMEMALNYVESIENLVVTVDGQDVEITRPRQLVEIKGLNPMAQEIMSYILKCGDVDEKN